MQLVDRYLLRRTVTALGFILLGLMVVVIAINLLSSMNTVVRMLARSKQEHPGRLITLLYVYSLPDYLGTVLIPSFICAALAVCAPMLKHGEFVAFNASGVGLRRVARAILWLAFAVGIFGAALDDQVIPQCRARMELTEDVIKGRVKQGSIWNIASTGAVWFASRTVPSASGEPRLENVLVAHPGSRLLAADRLAWHDGFWRLEGDLSRISIDADGAFHADHPDHVDCIGDYWLPHQPRQLYLEMLPAYTLTGPELVHRGGKHNLALVYGRWAQTLVPLLAVMLALAQFVRFANKNRLLVSSLRALCAAAVPALVVGIGRLVSDVSPLPPLAVIATALALAAAPAIVTYWRWKL